MVNYTSIKLEEERWVSQWFYHLINPAAAMTHTECFGIFPAHQRKSSSACWMLRQEKHPTWMQAIQSEPGPRAWSTDISTEMVKVKPLATLSLFLDMTVCHEGGAHRCVNKIAMVKKSSFPKPQSCIRDLISVQQCFHFCNMEKIADLLHRVVTKIKWINHYMKCLQQWWKRQLLYHINFPKASLAILPDESNDWW